MILAGEMADGRVSLPDTTSNSRYNFGEKQPPRGIPRPISGTAEYF